ncbi:hypothetical protein JVT61DRAFT_10751 [Boletus reticuloceps]|uniref:Uncharacterized protein n=1 Tax=Boletus reticuloceps TaxID=495285 RepID=A0A8I3A5H6_9AGAM|nr:hypothetical protein JVT61DRAFT_10751 [Boletus reticuloceps]
MPDFRSCTPTASAMLILQENIASNRAVMTICTTEAAVLDWDDEQLASSVQARLEDGQDVIVMADVTYNTALFSASGNSRSDTASDNSG